MSIKKVSCRIGTILAVAVSVATSQTTSQEGVKIGTVTWTKQNVNIETPNSWCYENDKSNCAKYGRLYTWEAAKRACQGMGGRWRLPTNRDWEGLMKAVGGVKQHVEQGDEEFVIYESVGKKLKSKSGWDDDGNDGTDDYGFSGLPGGGRQESGSFGNVGDGGRWWSATGEGAERAYIWGMGSTNDVVYNTTDEKGWGYAVRCSRD